MCTAISLTTRACYFGRNLDLEYTYEEQVAVTPRRFAWGFATKYAMVGMAYAPDGVPLYYEATNEAGLSMAGLHFQREAAYLPPTGAADEVPPYLLIPWVLAQCATLEEAKALLARTRVVAVAYSEALPITPLHWMVADRHASAAVEPLSDGLHVTDLPTGVLTNAPKIDYHITRLSEYTALSSKEPPCCFGGAVLTPYSRGMGGIGLPGDWSSGSRFVRASFVKTQAVSDGGEEQSVAQMMHVLGSVAVPRGCVLAGEMPTKTVYTSCCNADTGTYYYRTYENSRLTAVCMHACDLDGDTPTLFPMRTAPSILYETQER